MYKSIEHMRNRTDDLAIIAARAAMQFQDMLGFESIAVEAWADAIHGGIIDC